MAIANNQEPTIAEGSMATADGKSDMSAEHQLLPQDDRNSDVPYSETKADISTHDTSSPPTAQSPATDSDNSDPKSDDIYELQVATFSREEGEWSSETKSAHTPVSSLRVVTWNVDFAAESTASRVACILNYLQTDILSDRSQPSCVLLQELMEDSFDALLADAWVREHFAIIPPNVQSWPKWPWYGLATLVSRNIPTLKAQMLCFHRSRMLRTALLVDIAMCVPGSPNEQRVVRIANTHLESLIKGQPLRSVQLRAIARLLKEEGVTGGGLVGGDMNMIMPEDQCIHESAGLQDACDDPSATTWGDQPPTQYPLGRLDRIFYIADSLIVKPATVIGKGLKTQSGAWASDHYGLTTTIELSPLAEHSL